MISSSSKWRHVGLLGILLLFGPTGAPAGTSGRGDINNDGRVDISDAILLLEWLSDRADDPICIGTVDVNLDGKVNYVDAIHLLHSMFLDVDETLPYHPGLEPGCYGYLSHFVVRNEALTVLSPVSALVTWETPYRADTVVRYGLDRQLGDGEVRVAESAHFHQALLEDLHPDSNYYYRASSETPSGNLVESTLHTFRTLREPRYQVRAGRPRLFFNADDMPELRSRVAGSGEHAEHWKTLIAWCESKLELSAEEILESVNFLDYVRTLAFAGLVGKCESCREKALETAPLLLARDDRDSLRDTTEALAFIYDWLHPWLGESLESGIRNALLENCASLEANTNETEYVSGHSHGNTKSMLLALLALHGDHDTVPHLLSRVVDRYRYGFLATWRRFAGRDGGSSKGWWYSTYALPYELEFFAAWRSATGQDLFEQERSWCENLLDWFLFGLRGDGSFLREGDAYVRRGLEYQNRLFGRLAAREYGAPQARWLAGEAEDVAGQWGAHAWFDFLWDEPTVEPARPMGSTSRLFRNAGVAVFRESWERDAVIASFRSAEAYILGHQHADNCSFTLFYKGDLALDSGMYDSYDSDHHDNYYCRTIAHNTLTVFDPDEVFKKHSRTYANDGGQRWLTAGVDVETPWPWRPEDTVDRSKGFRLGGVLRYEDDIRYSYIVGDGGPSYSPHKVREFYRHFLWLKKVRGQDHPVAVVFDDVVATDASFSKTYLLHTRNRPAIEGRLVTAQNGEGVLFQWTLAPEDARLVPIGGPGKEFWVHGKNYPPEREPRGKEEPGGWRVEVSPSEQRIEDRFLHVLYPSDAGAPPPPEPPSFRVGGLQGVIVGEWIVLLDFGRPFLRLEYSSPIEESSHLVCGSVPLEQYEIYLDGVLQETVTSSFSGVVRFELASPGHVTIRGTF